MFKDCTVYNLKISHIGRTIMSKNKVDGQIRQVRGLGTKPYARLFGMEEMQFKGTVLKTAGKTQVYFGNGKEQLDKRR